MLKRLIPVKRQEAVNYYKHYSSHYVKEEGVIPEYVMGNINEPDITSIKRKKYSGKMCCQKFWKIEFLCRICGINITFEDKDMNSTDMRTVIKNHSELASHDCFKIHETNYNTTAWTLARDYKCPRHGRCGITKHDEFDNVFEDIDDDAYFYDENLRIVCVYDDCDYMDNLIEKNAERREELIRAVAMDMKNYEKSPHVKEFEIINPAIYDLVDCPCGDGKFAKCLICGVAKKVEPFVGYVKTRHNMYISAMMEHFGADRYDIKCTYEDFITPLKHKRYFIKDPEKDDEYYGYTMPIASFAEKKNFICRVCGEDYAGEDMPGAEVVFAHLRKCLAPLIAEHKKLGIKGSHDNNYSENYYGDNLERR